MTLFLKRCSRCELLCADQFVSCPDCGGLDFLPVKVEELEGEKSIVIALGVNDNGSFWGVSGCFCQATAAKSLPSE